MEREIYIDLYLQPSVSNIPYLNKEILMQERVTKKINELHYIALSDEAEFIAVASHSFYKEQMLTLNDYFTLAILAQQANGSKIIELAEKLNVIDSIKQVLGACKSVSEGLQIDLNLITLADQLGVISGSSIQSMPHKFPAGIVARILLKKIARDNPGKLQMARVLMANISLKQLKKFVEHIVRETY
jgi:hypothetical protein